MKELEDFYKQYHDGKINLPAEFPSGYTLLLSVSVSVSVRVCMYVYVNLFGSITS